MWPATMTTRPRAESRGPVVEFSPVRYPVDQLLLMNHLSSRGGVIVHAAGAHLGR